jgi:hypothetical protein
MWLAEIGRGAYEQYMWSNFGPFETEEEAQAFIDSVIPESETKKCDPLGGYPVRLYAPDEFATEYPGLSKLPGTCGWS